MDKEQRYSLESAWQPTTGCRHVYQLYGAPSEIWEGIGDTILIAYCLAYLARHDAKIK